MGNKKTKISIIYLVTIIAFLALFLSLFIVTANEIRENELVKFDTTVIYYVQGFISPKFTELMLVITFLGSVKWIIFAVIVVMTILLIKRKTALCLFLLLSSGAGSLFNILLKNIFKRARPDIQPLITEQGFSFPSGHSMGSFIFYGSLAYIIVHYTHKKGWKAAGVAIMALMIAGIGLSRIYLGVHYPSDIIGGFTAGGAWLTISIVLFRYYELRRNL